MLQRLFSFTLIAIQFVAVGVLATIIAVYVGTNYFGLQLKDRDLPRPWSGDHVAVTETRGGSIGGVDVQTINRFHLRIVDEDTGREMANFNLNPAIATFQQTIGPLTTHELLLILASFLIIIGFFLRRKS